MAGRHKLNGMTLRRFSLEGGHPVLNFVNTMSSWTGNPAGRRDYLPGFPEAIRFGKAAGLLSSADARRLAGLGGGAAELARLHVLRARLERVLRCVVGRGPVPAEDLAALSREAAAAAGTARLHVARVGLVRSVDDPAAGVSLLGYRLADQAVDLLTSALMARVKSCPGCGWFFLDASKNRSRRWCSMAACGSSAKARTYYRRRTARLA